MSDQLVVCLIALAANLAGVLLLYALLAHALIRLAWRGRGMLAAIAILFLTQLFWIVPAWLIVIPRDPDAASSYALWFGNWLVAGFALVLFSSTARSVPRSLEDSARLDGLTAFASWRQLVFPFVGRDLVLIGLFTVMATLLPLWGFVAQPQAGQSIVLFQRFLSPAGRFAFMAAVSIIGTLPLIAILLLAKPGRP
jgi:ABC-type glycerol-3-phosphate transport system permease component